MKAIVPRALANQDVNDAIDHDLAEAGETVALGFIEALERPFTRIARHPASGSPRYAHPLGLAELRFWPLGRDPYLVFYIEAEQHIDVWRVLHQQRDIPAWMNEG